MNIQFQTYTSVEQIEIIQKMIENELSEPYSVFTYRYFVDAWPKLCIFSIVDEKIVGVIIGKVEKHLKSGRMRGYIGMIVVEKEYRRLKIGKKLAEEFIIRARNEGAEEIVLETEYNNHSALRLY